MIPKIIHYCWFGGNPKPTIIEKYINTWRKHLNGYEIIEWNESNFDLVAIPWTREAMECKKYAFVSDYVRLEVLYKYGGIYLDTDVELIKTFDDLLHLPYFIGAEYTIHGINTATIGVEKQLSWIKTCLEHYNNRHFIVNGRMDLRVNPELIKDTLLRNGYNIRNIISLGDFSYVPKDFNIFPAIWFSPIKKGQCILSDQTYTIHHYAASWGNKSKRRFVDRIKVFLKAILPLCITQYILKRKKKKRDMWFDCRNNYRL